jgi:isopentenyldiphosphate isomerase
MNRHEIDIWTVAKLAMHSDGIAETGSALEPLEVIDDDGVSLGIAPRLICHRLGLLHRVVYCFIVSPDDRLLLQTRSDGRLDVSVGGHINIVDRDADVSMIREIQEEVGLEIPSNRLDVVGEYRRFSSNRLSKPREVNNELRKIYRLHLTPSEVRNFDGSFEGRRDRSAVLNAAWYSTEEILAACAAGMAADGLTASLPFFLHRINQQ